MSKIEPLLKYLIPLFVFLISFSIYVYCLAPTITAGDNIEMVTAAAVLGIPHHSSYPVNTIIGHLFSLMPLPGSLVWKINLSAALLHALAILAFYFLTLNLFEIFLMSLKKPDFIRIPQDSQLLRFTAFCSSLFLAFSLIFWQYSEKFEVFALNDFLVILMLLISASIRLDFVKENRHAVKTSRNYKFYLLAFVFGLAITHHQTSVLVFPAIILMIWPQLKKIAKDELKIFGLFLSLSIGMLSFLSLLYISSTNPPLSWGDPKNFGDAIAAFTRRDSGSFQPFAGYDLTQKYPPVEQMQFYLQFAVLDFSIIGSILALIGFLYTWKKTKLIFWFIILGFFVSGVVFLSYANFPFNSSYSQATLRRFHILPNIFMALFIAFGLFRLRLALSEINPKTKQEEYGLVFAKLLLIFLFVAPIVTNFSKSNHRGMDLTLKFTLDSFASTEDNALIMLSGDIPDMGADYYRYVEIKRNDHRIAFSPGQFHLIWFTPQLKKRYPDLIVPPALIGKQWTQASQIVEANYGKRPIYVNADLVVHDPVLEEKYVLWPRHMLFLVKKKNEDSKLEDFRAENDSLWENTNVESLQSVNNIKPAFEEQIVTSYLTHFYNVGNVFENVKLYDDAIINFKRALKIDPYFKEALAGLGRIYGFKMEKPDYQTALAYFQEYISVLRPGEEENFQAAQNTILLLKEKAQKDAALEAQKEAASASAKESSKSAKPK